MSGMRAAGRTGPARSGGQPMNLKAYARRMGLNINELKELRALSPAMRRRAIYGYGKRRKRRV
jgi:hypothetical protein